MTNASTLSPPLLVSSAVARTVNATKVYGRGDTAVRALDDVTVAFAPAASPRSWDRRARASRR